MFRRGDQEKYFLCFLRHYHNNLNSSYSVFGWQRLALTRQGGSSRRASPGYLLFIRHLFLPSRVYRLGWRIPKRTWARNPWIQGIFFTTMSCAVKERVAMEGCSTALEACRRKKGYHKILNTWQAQRWWKTVEALDQLKSHWKKAESSLPRSSSILIPRFPSPLLSLSSVARLLVACSGWQDLRSTLC